MSDNLTPVEVCERLIGPLPELEKIVGYRPKAAYGWRRESHWRDAGDIPSPRLMRRLLAHSAAGNLGLTADHLIWGASEDEIAAVLTARAAPAGLEAAE
jgi:hypothetical protein